MADINLSFDAQISNVTKAVKQIEKSLKGINTELKFTADTSAITKTIQELKTQLSGITSGTNITTNNTNSVINSSSILNSSNTATIAAMNDFVASQQSLFSGASISKQSKMLTNIKKAEAVKNQVLDAEIKTQNLEIKKNNVLAAQSRRTLSQQNTSLNISRRLSNYMNKYSSQFNGNIGLKNEGNKLLAEFNSGKYNDELGIEQQSKINSFMTACREAGIETDTLRSKVSNLFKEHLSTALVMVGVHAITQGLQDIYTNVVNIDTQMTELRKVTNETESTYNKFLDNASNRAIKLGATVADTVKATADMARLGYGLDEASNLADSAILLKNVGDGIDDIDDASEKIISSMKAFNIEAEDSTSIVDKYNEVGNNYSISSAGIAEAMQRSSAALASANNSIEESIGLTVGANAVVQDPEKVGTALKTYSMYLRACKSELEETGESTEGMYTSVSKLRDFLLKMTGNKVDIMKNNNDYKNTMEITRELAGVWNDLTDVNKANILEKIAGKRNANVISSLLSNFDEAEAAMNTALNSEGSALAENETYLDSIAGRTEQAKAKFEEFSVAILNSGFVKGTIQFGGGIIEGLTSITELLGSFPVIATTAMGALSAFGNKGKPKGFKCILYALCNVMVTLNELIIYYFVNIINKTLLVNKR